MILIIIIIFALTAYSTNENLGSPSKVYGLLVEAAKAHPVAGNAEGSYLTMRSKDGAIFFVINIVGNFGTVFVSSLPSPMSLPTTLASTPRSWNHLTCDLQLWPLAVVFTKSSYAIEDANMSCCSATTATTTKP